ncbi:hypothetical protein Q8W17_00495, partial [Photobacterium damselae subsp. piscicida]|nr:hypothetical protein [Photobacterium damselae subsp. piscicida]
ICLVNWCIEPITKKVVVSWFSHLLVKHFAHFGAPLSYIVNSLVNTNKTQCSCGEDKYNLVGLVR